MALLRIILSFDSDKSITKPKLQQYGVVIDGSIVIVVSLCCIIGDENVPPETSKIITIIPGSRRWWRWERWCYWGGYWWGQVWCHRMSSTPPQGYWSIKIWQVPIQIMTHGEIFFSFHHLPESLLQKRLILRNFQFSTNFAAFWWI